MHISKEHRHGAQIADTSLHLDVVVGATAEVGAEAATTKFDADPDEAANDLVGNDCTACIRLDIDEPKLEIKYKINTQPHTFSLLSLSDVVVAQI